MRLSLTLFGLALCVAAAAIVTHRASVEAGLPTQEAVDRLDEAPESFSRLREPELTLALEQLPQWRTDPVLVDPEGTYIESQQYYCAEDEYVPDKGFLWHGEGICGSITHLTESSFFEQPPYLHLSGRSYVALLLEEAPGVDLEWVARHLQYMRVLELGLAVELGVPLSLEEDAVRRLDPTQLRALLDGSALVLTQEHVWIASDELPGPGETHYGVYARRGWERALADLGFRSTPLREGMQCLARSGSVCFRAALDEARRLAGRAAILGMSALLLLLAGVLALAFHRLRAQRREEAARAFVLQMLSHEIRTPATSLALSLEPVRTHFDLLPEAVQGPFLRMCDSVQHLQRVIEASSQYLRGNLDGRHIDFKGTDIPDISVLLREVVADHGEHIAFRALPRRRGARLDAYWVGVCVKNLLQNASRHGTPPIAVQLSAAHREIRITVQDMGDGPELDFAEMTSPFGKRGDSPGLGLGLAVVRQLVEAMGGCLEFERDPSRFTLRLRSVLSPSELHDG